MKIIFIEDHVESRYHSFIIDKRMMTNVVSTWNIPDKILIDLSKTKFFENKTNWSSLSCDNFKFLICGSFDSLNKIPDEHITNQNIPEINSFQFIVSAFLYNLELNCKFKIKTMTISRIRPDHLDFDFSATSSLQLKNIATKPSLKIIVDNTKEKDE